MPRLVPFICAGALFMGLPASGVAQTPNPGRVEVLGVAALHPLWDDEGFLGSGVAGGTGVRTNLTDRIGLRGRVVRSRNERDFGNGVVFEADATRYTAEVIWQVSASPHAPYFGAGAGVFSYERVSSFPSAPPAGPSTFISRDTDTVVGGLGGVPVVATDRFRLAPEASLWWSRPGYFIVIEVGLVASYRF